VAYENRVRYEENLGNTDTEPACMNRQDLGQFGEEYEKD
jgi:hypothetical protein